MIEGWILFLKRKHYLYMIQMVSVGLIKREFGIYANILVTKRNIYHKERQKTFNDKRKDKSIAN